ncbi:MAG: hypothetical protein FWF88_03015 [Peptococcaceae bacterium]|nr:hypothetical protein [Peptococcaceae bacterium]
MVYHTEREGNGRAALSITVPAADAAVTTGKDSLDWKLFGLVFSWWDVFKASFRLNFNSGAGSAPTVIGELSAAACVGWTDRSSETNCQRDKTLPNQGGTAG